MCVVNMQQSIDLMTNILYSETLLFFKEVGYITKPSYNMVSLLVPALISLFLYPILWETRYNKDIFMVPRSLL